MHQGLVTQVLAGVSDKALGGRTKARRMAGMMAPPSRGAVTPVTLGAITKTTGNSCLYDKERWSLIFFFFFCKLFRLSPRPCSGPTHCWLPVCNGLPVLVLCRSNTWTNTPKPQQGWSSGSGNGSEGWGKAGDLNRPGTNSHWGEPQKGSGSMGWDSDSDRSGSGCWSEPGRNAKNSNTWGGSGGTNTPDQSTPNPGSNWGDPTHKPNPPQSNSQGWGEPVKNSHGTKNWVEPSPKPSNEWGKGPESSTSRGTQGPTKPSGRPNGFPQLRFPTKTFVSFQRKTAHLFVNIAHVRLQINNVKKSKFKIKKITNNKQNLNDKIIKSA